VLSAKLGVRCWAGAENKDGGRNERNKMWIKRVKAGVKTGTFLC
jgi:hypothetical protein